MALKGLPSGRARIFGIGLIALLAIALVVVIVLGGLGKPARSYGSPLPSGSLTAFQQALQGIGDDGSFSKDTALRVFAAAFGPLPGVDPPPRDTSYRSGTAALEMVEAYWSELTTEQRSAIRRYLGDGANAVLPPESSSNVELVSYRSDPDQPAVPLAATYQELADKAAADIAGGIGHPLGIPIRVVASPVEDGDAWAWASGNFNEVPAGSPPSACVVSIPPSTLNDSSRVPYLRWLLLHEVWHCFEHLLVSYPDVLKAPKWISEGEASWVAEAITGGAGAPPPASGHWDLYVQNPAKSLYARAYDGVGFFAQLAQAAIDPWTVIEPTYKAGVASGSDAGFVASGATNQSFLDRWGSSWMRDGSPSNGWAMTAGYGIPPVTDRATSQSFTIGDGDNGQIEAKPVSGAIADIDTTAFVTRFEVPAGTGRVGEQRANGLDRPLRAATLDLCTNPSGCACPNGGSGLTGTTPITAGPKLRAAATGEQKVTSIVTFRGISKAEWCGPEGTPQGKPCQTNCGGSNGDPHLRTIDGHRYDFQATGEYVLLRNADASIELQARAEAAICSGGVTCGVTINTAVAMRVNGHRVGFNATAGTGILTVMLDGVALAPEAIGAADLGSGARLTAYPKGYQLDLSDGTQVWALSLGASFGINVLVHPSEALRSAGVGLLGPVPSIVGARFPRLPDGSALPLPVDRHDRWHQLYEVLGPAWRVTQANSLFDYAAGTTTDSYSTPGFPAEAAPLSVEDLAPGVIGPARTACGTITDPDLADECAFDVATTGSTEYVTLYGLSDDFQAQGPVALGAAPGPTPTPRTGGGPPTGIVVVDDHLVGAAEAKMGPDGTVYVEVGEQAQAFGDTTLVLLAIDGRTGAIKQRAVGVAAGRLAWAAGSIWAGEFQRGDFGCQVSRLDPVTLAPKASIPTVCYDGGTLLVALDDAPWFIDPTGAGPNGEGAHLQRIDPATNKLDTTADGRIELPYANSALGRFGFGSLLTTTSGGVIYGERHDGMVRVNLDGSVDPLGSPGTFSAFFPAGDGVWTQTVIGDSGDPNGTAEFYTGGSSSVRRVGLIGDLIGADDSALYSSYAEEDAEPDGFWRFPIDGGGEQQLAGSGFTPNGFGGQTRLLYRDILIPLLIGDGLAVKLWIAPSPTAETQSALLLQSIPLP